MYFCRRNFNNELKKVYMAKDLTVSQIERQNVLNNNWALPRIREALDVQAMEFDGKLYLTKQMVADFYEVSLSTVDRYLEQNAEELKHNGYVLCKGKALKEWKLQFGHLINDATKTTILGLFDFRSFLNMGMLLSVEYGTADRFEIDYAAIAYRKSDWRMGV